MSPTAAANSKLPSLSVLVAVDDPFTATLAPTTGRPRLSVIFPFMGLAEYEGTSGVAADTNNVVKLKNNISKVCFTGSELLNSVGSNFFIEYELY